MKQDDILRIEGEERSWQVVGGVAGHDGAFVIAPIRKVSSERTQVVDSDVSGKTDEPAADGDVSPVPPQVESPEEPPEGLEYVPFRLGPAEVTPGEPEPMLRQSLPSDSAARKALPVCSGVIDYFPDALVEVARVSVYGNEKHNPGEPLHHARGKSMDHADSIARHLIDRGKIDPDTGLLHDSELAWRALANLQQTLEDMGLASLPRGASND